MYRVPRILVVVLCLALPSCAAKSLKESDWLQITTPHYEVVSALGRESTLQLAGDLERMRAAAEFLVGERLRPASLRTRVFAFDDRSLTRPFDLRGQPSYFLPTLEGGIIVLRTGGGWRLDTRWKLRHDYAHHLLRNHQGFRSSLWVDEGFAQFLSTLEIDDETATMGVARKDHLLKLRNRLRLSLPRLLQMHTVEGVSEEERAAFDAEAWALLHYLSFRVGPPIDGAKQRRRYFEMIAAGKPRPQAFAQAFGVEEDDVEKKLFGYVREKRFDTMEVKLPNTWKPTPSDIHELTKSEAMVQLGQLSLALSRADQAREYFKLALAADPEDPDAQAGLSAAARLQGMHEEAAQHGFQALEASGNPSAAHLEIARAYHEQALETDTGEEQVMLISKAQHHYRKSIDANPNNPAPKALLGATYLVGNQDPSMGAGHLVAAQRQLPSSLSILLLQAQLAAAQGRDPDARYHARTIRARSHSAKQSDAAGELLKRNRGASR